MEALTDKHARRAVMAAALLSLAMTIAFAAAFQLSKSSAISAISPFAEDPTDAVASIGVQIALAGTLIAFVRWARLYGDPEFLPDRARLVLPGCELAAAAVGVTVITDVTAIILSPLLGRSPWETALIDGLAAVGTLSAATGIATLVAVRSLRRLPRGESLAARNTLADLIEDGLIVTGRIAGSVGRRVPPLGDRLGQSSRRAHRAWNWLNRSWISPRLHPGRFIVSFALFCGMWLLAAKFILEGETPNPTAGVIAGTVYIGVELVAVLGGYLLFGGWLAIRPPLRRHS